MRILMTALHPGGGIRTFFRYVYSQPCFKDCTFVLVAPNAGLSEFLTRHVPDNRICVVPADVGHVNVIKQIRTIIKTGDFDLVHSHGFSAGILTELARVSLTVPHLMTAHDVFLTSQFQGWNGRLKRFLMARLFRRMSGIHTVTDDARANLLEFFPTIGHSRVHGILHGVDTEYFRDSDVRDIKNELGLSRDTPLIGFFGRFMGQKGFRILIDAIDEVISGGLVSPLPHIVTFGWGGFIREEYQYIHDKGLGDYFHQMPQTDDMPSALKGVDLVAMPSRWEACGLLAMEVLAAGVPIIGTDCIGLREVLNGSPAKQVPVGDRDALTQAIVNEIDHLDLRRSMFSDFQSQAVDQFNIARPANALYALYHDISRC